jgi:hypothetical protein
MTSGTGNMGKKLLALAKDIVQWGLSPADKPMVIKDDNNEDEFIVIEGNRRVTALHLLSNPDIAPTEEWKKRFAKAKPAGFSPIKEIPCVLCHDLQHAFHFIEIKHLGESGGAGVVTWDTEQKARQDERADRRSRHHKALAVLDYVRNSEQVPDGIKSCVGDRFSITTLDRLLSDKDFRAFMGLGLDGKGRIVFEVAPSEALRPLYKVLKDFSDPNGKTVHEVINKKERDNYMKEFKSEDRPNRDRMLPIPLLVQRAPAGKRFETDGREGRKHVDPTNRRYVPMSGANLPIDGNRFNRAKRVYEELKHIPLRDRDGTPRYPNAGALLLRLFIEMSVGIYISQKELSSSNPEGWRDISLIEQAKAVLNDLRSAGRLLPQEAKVVSKVLGDKKKLANPNSLHDLAHNIHQIPTPADLIDIWDTYNRFLMVLWEVVDG